MVRLKVIKNGDDQTITPDHPDGTAGRWLLMKAIGTTDPDFLSGILKQLANASSQDGYANEDNLNFALSVVKGITPKDHVEAMLATQMAAVHMATITFARRLAHVDNIQQQDSAERAYNKLARTFISQMEALKRYRTGGEQKVTVQHVSVSEGGQAIVGNVTQAPRGDKTDAAAASPPALTDAKAQPMPAIAEHKERISVPAQKKSREK